MADAYAPPANFYSPLQMSPEDWQKVQAMFAPTDSDKAAARKMGLLNFGLALMGTRKGEEWGGLGRAGLLGTQTYENQIADLAKQRTSAIGQAAALQNIAYQGQDLADRNLERNILRRGIPQGLPQIGAQPPAPTRNVAVADSLATMPTGPATAMLPMTDAAVNGPSSPPAQNPQALRRQRVADLEAIADALTQAGLGDKAEKYRDLAAKMMPEVKETRTMTDKSGNRVSVNIYKDGTTDVVPFGPDKEKLHFADTGNAIVGLDPITGVPVGNDFRKSQSPDSAASNALGYARLNQEASQHRDTMNKPHFDVASGQWLAPPAAGSMAPGSAANPEGFAPGVAKQASMSRQSLKLLDGAESIINEATGSYAGAAIDQAARFFGKATSGAEATSRLKVLEAKLMMSQPRMEGQQSNLDVLLYREAAGQIGDPTVPRAQKLAALQTIRQLHEKYGGVMATNGTPQESTGRIVDFNTLQPR